MTLVIACSPSNQYPCLESICAYVTAEPCMGSRTRRVWDACPADCIHPRKNKSDFDGAQQLFIDPVECIDCNACVPVCPVLTIFALDDLPISGSCGFLTHRAAHDLSRPHFVLCRRYRGHHASSILLRRACAPHGPERFFLCG